MSQKPIVLDAPTPEPRARTAEALEAEILEKLTYSVGKDPIVARPHDWLKATILAVRDRIIDLWMESSRSTWRTSGKRVYYLSLEFLIGRLMRDAMSNIGLMEPVRQALKNLNVDLGDLISLEPDAALGNGGLGRLAACFMDSMATLQIPAYGYGIRYQNGMFRQEMSEGWQVELPEDWLVHGNPWEFERRESTYEIGFGGQVVPVAEPDGSTRLEWRPAEHFLAVAFDTPIVGWRGARVNTLRLWSAQPVDPIYLDKFNSGDHIGALEESSRAEAISRVLYPADSTPSGQELRLRQEYFFSSASLQDIVRRHMQQYGDMGSLPDKVAIQLNDTHPAMAVPELMRILLDEAKLGWDEAWDLTVRTLAYTNHTLLPEALEKWPVGLFEDLLPRHLEIVYEVNRRFLDGVKAKHPGDEQKLARVSLIEEGGERKVRMANLAIVGTHSTNGVAAIHSELLRTATVPDFAELFPERFNNKTNGVTPRRWLLLANPDLAKLLTDAVGDGWVADMSLLRKADPLAADAGFREKFLAAKRGAKARFVDWVKATAGVSLDPDTLFDVQIKRIHEYKRQLLNALCVVVRYNRLRADPNLDVPPRTVLFAGKAAPAYHLAKVIIKLISNVAKVVNSDPVVSRKLRVEFLPNYSCTLAEHLIPAADLSEQISTAGYEASGTSNMKFMMNGALTIGTRDGANIEIAEEAGQENAFMFGLTAEQVIGNRGWYNPRWHYENDPETRAALDLIFDNHFSPDEPGVFEPIRETLLAKGDYYMHLADLPAYVQTQQMVSALYQDRAEWAKKAIHNVARSGKFSSDRTIFEYARDVWGADPCPVE